MVKTLFESVKPWDAKEKAHYHNTAAGCFQHSYKHTKPDPDNCCSCALITGKDDEDGPNVAGWARIYVEAGVPIPATWKAAFSRELNSTNSLYAAALARSIATFGQPRFV